MWYVIHTVSGMEQKCLQQCGIHLDRDDYNEMFIPRYIAQKHFKKEWHEVEKTLFPGYLFVDTEKIGSVIEGLKKVSTVYESVAGWRNGISNYGTGAAISVCYDGSAASC